VPQPTAAGGLIVIGASTGGTEAIRALLASFPADCPPTLITQHIPAGFSRAFAQHLNADCAMEVKEAEDSDQVTRGRVLIAPGNFHMLLARTGGGFRVTVKDGPRVCYQRPAVDVLFESVAREKVARTVGVLLTGMGTDGAQGLLHMRQRGAFTIAQDERSCVVFGMPREAIRLGAASRVAPLNRIAGVIFDALSGKAGSA
jgi:two-component system chemotaxis response regulator CheB